jgi:hypothetical protein
MYATRFARRALPFAATVAVLLAAGACSDDPAAPEEEPEVQTLTLTVGSSTITINKTTGSASGNLVVPLGVSTVTAVWRKADNSLEDLITSGEFELRIEPVTPSNLSWVASGAFGGTLTTTGLTSGQTTTAKVSLYHIVSGHPDFGEYTITIQIQ